MWVCLLYKTVVLKLLIRVHKSKSRMTLAASVRMNMLSYRYVWLRKSDNNKNTDFVGLRNKKTNNNPKGLGYCVTPITTDS